MHSAPAQSLASLVSTSHKWGRWSPRRAPFLSVFWLLSLSPTNTDEMQSELLRSGYSNRSSHLEDQLEDRDRLPCRTASAIWSQFPARQAAPRRLARKASARAENNDDNDNTRTENTINGKKTTMSRRLGVPFGDHPLIFQSYIRKGISRQGIGASVRKLLRFDTMPCRHMPLLVHSWL